MWLNKMWLKTVTKHNVTKQHVNMLHVTKQNNSKLSFHDGVPNVLHVPFKFVCVNCLPSVLASTQKTKKHQITNRPEAAGAFFSFGWILNMAWLSRAAKTSFLVFCIFCQISPSVRGPQFRVWGALLDPKGRFYGPGARKVQKTKELRKPSQAAEEEVPDIRDMPANGFTVVSVCAF